ncbi:hypothetical protein F443_15477 [Phytophthora nicotianae P1569]|uniref:RxLR effector protein n=1 Tax=Phytophthora nicotianae P1569 TaxID=1317065 RepID=V9EIC5_PHYNI|nr:hypothetical protein F443_15477 [Phytophthora nicotianae P1569]
MERKLDPYTLLLLAIKKQVFIDVQVAEMINSAKQDIHTGSIASKMEEAQFLKWSKDGNSDEGLSKRLGLNKAGDNLFESPMWGTWSVYVESLLKDPYESLVLVLKRTGSHEVDAVRMVNTAKLDSRTKSIAENMEELQFQKWLADGKKPRGNLQST